MCTRMAGMRICAGLRGRAYAGMGMRVGMRTCREKAHLCTGVSVRRSVCCA